MTSAHDDKGSPVSEEQCKEEIKKWTDRLKELRDAKE